MLWIHIHVHVQPLHILSPSLSLPYSLSLIPLSLSLTLSTFSLPLPQSLHPPLFSLPSLSPLPSHRRKLNSLALSKHTQLLEILEIPQVMETCVRNSYYEEALDLNTHVRRMDKKHGEIPIVKVHAHVHVTMTTKSDR